MGADDSPINWSLKSVQAQKRINTRIFHNYIEATLYIIGKYFKRLFFQIIYYLLYYLLLFYKHYLRQMFEVLLPVLERVALEPLLVSPVLEAPLIPPVLEV